MTLESVRSKMEAPQLKAALRDALIRRATDTLGERGSSAWGPIAERIRRLPLYKTARHLLCPPLSDLFQVRWNGLMDGKTLTVPTPGLEKGFLRLDPASIPRTRLFQVARLRGEGLGNLRVPLDCPAEPPIDLVIAAVLAADSEGHVLGDGAGHLDIQVAVLNELGWLNPNVVLIGASAQDALLAVIPSEPTDVRVHWIVTPARTESSTFSGFPHAAVHWNALSPKAIRRNAALFHLQRALRERTSGFLAPDRG